MIVLDANVLVSAVLGRRTALQLESVVDAGIYIATPAPQSREALRVLIEKLGYPREVAEALLGKVSQPVRTLEPSTYQRAEAAARARLHARAQPDWPVLAAALAHDGAIWSNDRDFFGVGVPVWSTRNVTFAAQSAS